MTMERGLCEGIRLFNAEKYFEAHEAMEAVWLKASGDRKTFLHSLIQVAAAFHHHARGNFEGFRSLLEKGCTKLEKFKPAAEGVNVAGLLLQLQPWREYLRSAHGPARASPPLPVIRRRNAFRD
jgi:predicted metal-dependent hydrolase